jgi:hypothetical protein
MQTGSSGMTRGNTTISQGGQEATTTENERAATRSGGAKRGGGAVGLEALAQHQRMIGGGQWTMKKILQSKRIHKDGGRIEERRAQALMSWGWPRRQSQSIHTFKRRGPSREGWK